MAKKQEDSGWEKVKDFFGFKSSTKTTTSSTTISLSREEADEMKQKVFDLTKHASKGVITQSLNEALAFAEECEHEFNALNEVVAIGVDS